VRRVASNAMSPSVCCPVRSRSSNPSICGSRICRQFVLRMTALLPKTKPYTSAKKA